jgi:Flp pilus assembly protein, ATPase CpaF
MVMGMDKKLYEIETKALDLLKGKFVNLTEDKKLSVLSVVLKEIDPGIAETEIKAIFDDINDMGKLASFMKMGNIEDIMVNNVNNVFVYDAQKGYEKVSDIRFDKENLEILVKKLRLYATNEAASGNIMDVHLPTKNRASIVYSPKGYDITIRNFSGKPLSILDLVNLGELDYNMAARLWLYLDGFRIRPANIMLGGIAASGKTTLLNSMFSFFRPDMRIVTIEDTYELNTSLFENSVNLETNEEMDLRELIKAAMRMRADAIVIGEVRGAEAQDMVSAMNIGKMSVCTIHASSARDVINRLTHSPMSVPDDIISVIDAILVLSRVKVDSHLARKIVQISEISGRESQILLSDLYRYDYRTKKSSDMLPSVSYRDSLSKAIGVDPSEIIAEEHLRALILAKLDENGKRTIGEISESVQDYYDNPERLLQSIGMTNMTPIIRL